MMYIHINYGKETVTVPSVDPAVLARATADDLRVLLCLCAADITLSGENMDDLCATVGRIAGCGAITAAASVAFWRGVGVLALSDTASETQFARPSAQKVPVGTVPAVQDKPTVAEHVTVRRAADQLPHYTSSELADLLESRPEARESIDECNRIWGNLLNSQEINTVLALSDYLGLEWDYILSLMARCVEDMDNLGARHSMRYVEKQALAYYDEDIRTLDALQDKFRALDKLRSTEGRLRTLFGMGERKLTPRETKFFSTWLHDFGYDYEIIELAYNVAVDAKGEPKMSYINSVLANWDKDGLRTPAAIEEAQLLFLAERDRKKTAAPKPAAPAQTGSFDTESVFDAAVRRSLGEKPEA